MDRARAVGADLSALYAFADAKNLYLRLDQYGGFSLPPAQPFEYAFDLTSPEWGNRSYQINIPNTGAPFRLFPMEGTTLLAKEQKIYHSVAIGQVLETVVPLEILKNPSQIVITAYVHAGRDLIIRLLPATVVLQH